MIGYRENPKLTHLLGLRVAVCNPAAMTVTGLFFVVEDANKFIDKTKKYKEKLSVPNFSIELFKKCVGKLQREVIIGGHT